MGVITGSGERLIVYTNELSAKVKNAVTELLEAAAYALEKRSQSEDFDSRTYAEQIDKMCSAGMIGMTEI